MAGCATTVNGTGSAAKVVHPKVAASFLRTPESDALGDPVRSDFCVGISDAAFAKYGDSGPDLWQPADYCLYDIEVAKKYQFEIDVTSIYRGIPVSGQNYMTRSLSGGDTYDVFAATDGDCERVLHVGDIELDINTYVNEGKVSNSILCGAAETMTRQLAASYTHAPLPTRALALPTITTFDLCALTAVSHFDQIAGFTQDGGSQQTQDEEASCHVDGSDGVLDVSYVYADLGYRFGTDVATVGGHKLYVYEPSSQDVCYVDSLHGVTTDHQSREVLDFRITSTQSNYSYNLCSNLEKFAAAMLDAAHLK